MHAHLQGLVKWVLHGVHIDHGDGEAGHLALHLLRRGDVSLPLLFLLHVPRSGVVLARRRCGVQDGRGGVQDGRGGVQGGRSDVQCG